MKISQLIKELKNQKDNYGDCEINCYNCNGVLHSNPNISVFANDYDKEIATDLYFIIS